MPEADDTRAKMSLYLDEARWRRDDQNQRIRGLDQKLTTVSVLNAGAVAVFAAALTFSSMTLPAAAGYLLYSALSVFCVNIAASAYAYLISRWSRRPPLNTLRRHLHSYSHESIVLWTADQIFDGLAENEETISRKSRWVTISIVLSALTVLLIGATAGVAFGLS